IIAITNSPSENHTHRGVVSCDRCFIASSQPGRTIQAQALDSRNCAWLLGCRGICPHRLARYRGRRIPISALVCSWWAPERVKKRRPPKSLVRPQESYERYLILDRGITITRSAPRKPDC